MESLIITLAITLLFFLDDKMKEPRVLSLKTVCRSLLIVAIIQIFWATLFFIDINSSTQYARMMLYSLLICLTTITMYKWVDRIGYWLITNIIISLIAGMILLTQLTQPALIPSSDVGIAFLFTPFKPLIMGIINLYFQLGVWLLVVFQKWLDLEKNKQRKSTKEKIIDCLKLLGFQVALSCILQGVLRFDNVFLTCLVLVCSSVLVYMVRKKMWANYMIWVLTWLAIDQFIILFCHNGDVPISLRTGMDTSYLYIFIVYHFVITIILRLKAGRAGQVGSKP